MNKSINLLIPEKHDTLLAKRISLLRTLSLSVLVFIVIAAVTLFFLILSSSLPDLRQQEAATSQKLRGLQSISQKYFIVRERLGVISTILQERTDFEQYITTIQENLPSGVTITEIRSKDNSLAITASSSSLLSLNAFIEAMYQLKRESKLFSAITLSQLTFSEDQGNYAVTISSTMQL